MSNARRGAPHKKGLNYFPKMIDFYDDDKIIDLLEKYGPLGVTIYDVILTIVYHNGYYVELSKDKLSRMVIRKIGNRWVKQKVVVQVIQFCADIGLLCDELLTQNVITSVGIQTRYQEIALKQLKRQLYNDKYWLLDREKIEDPLLKLPKNGISSEINGINSEESQLNSELNTPRKEEKRKEYIYYGNPELDSIFKMYIAMRNSSQKNPLLPEQIQILKEELDQAGEDDAERIGICKRAFAGGYKSFFPDKKKEKRDSAASKKNAFHNFDQREYDFNELEKRLTGRKQ